MLKVALTGGIATGKSSVREWFESLGIPTIDADSLAHDALRPSSPTLQLVVERFGKGVLAPDGTVDRRALGALVFADAAARKDLEALVHPAVYAAIGAWFLRLATPGGPPIAIADIPLLYETNDSGAFDRVIVATCDRATQLARAVTRGLSEEEAHQRIAAQMPLAEKVRRADYVIDTNGSMEQTHLQVADVLRQLQLIGPDA
jgi:dephospho-CoA kinase